VPAWPGPGRDAGPGPGAAALQPAAPMRVTPSDPGPQPPARPATPHALPRPRWSVTSGFRSSAESVDLGSRNSSGSPPSAQRCP
jgi:hypothetical protein